MRGTYQGTCTEKEEKKMKKKVLSFVVIVAGIIILLGSLSADLIGIGVAGFGYKQITGTTIGAIIGVIGLILYLKWGRIPESKS